MGLRRGGDLESKGHANRASSGEMGEPARRTTISAALRFMFQNKNNIKHKTKTTLQWLGTINGTVNIFGPAKAQT